MIEPLIHQLQSVNRGQRREAIMALANLKDPAALPALAAVFRRDTDPELRDLALRAGQYIRQHAPVEAESTGAAGADASSAEAGPASSAQVSERDRELARGLLNSATDYHIAGDRPRAIESLGKALSMDPTLQQQKFVQNLVLNVMGGMALSQAVATLTHADRRNALIRELGGKQKLKKRQEHGAGAETATWDNVLVDFALYGLMAIMSTVTLFLFALQALQDLLDNVDFSATANAASNLDPLLSASLVGLLIMAVVTGIYQVISMALQGLFIHAAATYILGGDGTLVYLYRRMVPLQTVILLVGTVLVVLALLSGDIMGLLILISLGATVGSLAVFVVIARLVGQVYNFGAWTGCGAILLGGILQAVISYIGSYFLFGLFSLALGG